MSKDYLPKLISYIQDGKTKGLLKPSAIGHYKECYDISDDIKKDCDISEDYVVLVENTKYKPVSPNGNQLILCKLKALGLKTPTVVYHAARQDHYFEVQEKAKGNVLFQIASYERLVRKEERIDLLEHAVRQHNKERLIELLSAPDEQYADYFKSVYIAHLFDLANDLHSNNVMYDKVDGFSIIDLPTDFLHLEYIEDLKEKLNNSNCNPVELKDVLFKPFKTALTMNASPLFYNLVGHKILAGAKHCDLNLNTYYLEDLEKLLTGKNDKYSDSPACDDKTMKLTLCNIGLLEPTREEQANIDALIGQDRRIALKKGYKHLYLNEDRNERYDKKYLARCIESTTIDGMPAIDYFENTDGSMFDFVKKDLDKLDATADTMEQ